MKQTTTIQVEKNVRELLGDYLARLESEFPPGVKWSFGAIIAELVTRYGEQLVKDVAPSKR